MAKGGKAKKRNSPAAWTGADHADREAKHEAKRHTTVSHQQEVVSYRKQRQEQLGHETKGKLEASKLRLHITKTQRAIALYRERLVSWDDVEEAKREKQRRLKEELERKERDGTLPKKKRGRLGPETWKLRGAARPAWEVYDFDTRYVDPYIKAHEDAKEKAQRVRNLLVLYKGRFGEEPDSNNINKNHHLFPPQPHCRNFVSLLMQVGMLSLQAKKLKAARLAFLECMDLEGPDQPITTARCHLMRLYLDANRPESARRLWEKLPSDKSVWIRFSATLLEFVSWKLLGETGSTRESAESMCAQAIRANVFCAYHIAYHGTFERVVEYTEDIEDAPEETLEEAIEYCCSEQMGAWVGTEGAIDFLRNVILKTLHYRNDVANGALSRSDLEWSEKLKKIEDDYEEEMKRITDENDEMNDDEQHDDDNDQNDDQQEKSEGDESDQEADVLMYAGMFRTAMDMLEDAGEFLKEAKDSDSEEERDSDKNESNDEDENSNESE